MIRQFVLLTILYVVLVAAANFSVGVYTPASPGFWENRDQLHYMAVARGYPAWAPFAYRILTPTIAGHLPFDLLTNFQLVTFGSLWLAGMLMYPLLRAWDLPPRLALVGVVLLYCNYWVVPMGWANPWLCDTELLVFAIGALWAAKKGNAPAFVTCILIGMLNKETILAMTPLWFTLHPRARWRVGVMALVGVAAIYGGQRLLIPVYGPPTMDYLGLFRSRWATFNLYPITLGLFGPFIVLPFLSALGRQIMIRFAPSLTILYAQLWIASDTERLLISALPLLVLASLTTWYAWYQAARRHPQRLSARVTVNA